MNPVAERYAQAFFSLAKDEGRVAEFKDEAVTLRRACSRELTRLLDMRSIGRDEKKALFAECLKGADPYLMNLLNLLIDKGRGRHLPEILDMFVKYCNEELNIQEALVYSARPLTEDETAQIARAISDRFGKQVEITNRIDESLLAGTRIFINDRVYDSSLKAKVRSLKEELLKESW